MDTYRIDSQRFCLEYLPAEDAKDSYYRIICVVNFSNDTKMYFRGEHIYKYEERGKALFDLEDLACLHYPRAW